jgi:hypothetical protein
MKFVNASASLVGFLALSACSQNGSVALRGMDVSTNLVGTDTYINMNATLATGNLKFPNVEFPIINPTNLQVFGQMALMNNPDGTNKVYVSVDYTQSTHLNGSLGNTLPNSRELPSSLGIPTGTVMIGIPILNHSRIYVGGDMKHDAFVGAAIAIPAFDSAMNQILVPLNIFFGYPSSPSITGFAGLFTGPLTGQNGIAVFVKKNFETGAVTPVIVKKSYLRETLASKATTQSIDAQVQPQGGEELSQLSNSSLIKLDRLFKKKAVLKIH